MMPVMVGMLAETIPPTVATVLADVNTIFTQALTWVGNVSSTVSANPIMLIPILLPLVGLGIGFFKRLINL
jgi:hypothetical protein